MKITSLSLLAVALLSAHAGGKVISWNLFGITDLDLDYKSGINNGNVEYSIGLVGDARELVQEWSLTYDGDNVNFYVEAGRIFSGPAKQSCQHSQCLFRERAGPDPKTPFRGAEKLPGHQATLDSFMASKYTFIRVNVHFKDGTHKSAKIDELAHK